MEWREASLPLPHNYLHSFDVAVLVRIVVGALKAASN
jgi:hypothetical protein